MKHHLLRETDQKAHCLYCGHSWNGEVWESFWEDQIHYKITSCQSCGKRAMLKIDYDSDGNDSFGLELKVLSKETA